jgi:hypothetical protein
VRAAKRVKRSFQQKTRRSKQQLSRPSEATVTAIIDGDRHRETLPCGTFAANAVFFAIGVLTYNLYLGFRADALGSGWQRSQVQTVRWRLLQTAGKIVRHGRQTFLKISAAMVDVFVAIRERCARIMREGGAVPKTSQSLALARFGQPQP